MAERFAPAVVRDAGEDDDEVYLVGIRETDDPESWTLTFMAPFDEGDPYCLVVDPGQATHYGGVRSYELVGDRLRLGLTEEAADVLGLPVDTEIRLDLPPDKREAVAHGLRRVLAPDPSTR